MLSLWMWIPIIWVLYWVQVITKPTTAYDKLSESLNKRESATLIDRVNLWFTNLAEKMAQNLGPTQRRLPNKQRRQRRTNTSMRKILAMTTVLAATQMSATQAAHHRKIKLDTDSRNIGVDNRASACISDNPVDFIPGSLKRVKRIIKGFQSTTQHDIYQGTIKWTWEDDDGRPHTFTIPESYYIPNSNGCLLSPQHWAQTQKDYKPEPGTVETTDHKQVTLQWKQRRYTRTVPLTKGTNVGTMRLAPGYSRYRAMVHKGTIPTMECSPHLITDDDMDGTYIPTTDNPWTQEKPQSVEPTTLDLDMSTAPPSKTTGIPVVEPDEDDLSTQTSRPTTDEALLLQLHQRMGHIPEARLLEMAKNGTVPKRLAKIRLPMCAACQYAKATRKPWRNKTRLDYTPGPPKDPGEVISVDQLVSPSPGLVAQMTGRLTIQRYKYATVYVDHSTRWGYVHYQKTATAEETIEGKRLFEQEALQRGVRIKGYHADNGIFRAKKWQAHCSDQRQTLTFAGVNAHHTNGMAEKRIRDLQDLTRAQLIHANQGWKQCITANLWPYAMRMANDSMNNTPSMCDKGRLTPEQLFSKTNVHINTKHYAPFGCPVYVLSEKRQAQKPSHKWTERAKVGIYLGPSPQHGRNVSLVLSRATGLVSPQFHVKFDINFDTPKQCNFNSQWQEKADLINPTDKTQSTGKRKPTATKVTFAKGTNLPKAQTITPQEGDPSSEGAGPKAKRQRVQGTRSSPRLTTSKTGPPQAHALVGNHGPPNRGKRAAAHLGLATPDPQMTNKSSHPQREHTNQANLIEAALLEIQNAKDSVSPPIEGELFCMSTLLSQPTEQDPLYIYKTTADPDTMYHHEAMRQPDKIEFKKAMTKEITDRLKEKSISLMLRSALPQGAHVLPAVWQMRRKRDIATRKIKKYKARLNIDGSRMTKGIHYDESYAPVASWNAIRFLLTMTAVHGWHTKQLDYVAAFPQAPITRELYMKLPAGITLGPNQDPKDYVFKVHRNLYGQKNAGRVWNDYLVDKLLKIGFKQSKIDRCVFYHGNVMYALYTDDSILAGPDPKEIDKIIQKMRDIKLDITIEGDLEDFLGVQISRKADGTIHLTQPHLIDSILEDLGLTQDNVTVKKTPASPHKILMRHATSDPFDNSFNYRSVIGKLNYLERGSRSDIAYIVHQCARFTSDPKKEHGDALKYLGRYLRYTRDKGTILTPNHEKGFEVYVDADFAGNFDRTNTQNRDTARSRHGYIIMYKGCPLTWKSQLQTEITLSSTESEYTGLSYALRETIPLMQLLKEMQSHNFPIETSVPDVKCKVFEDNSGALEIARTHKYRPRTKHLNVKLHHFRDYVTRGDIRIYKIGTLDQLADYLTKPVPLDILLPLRKSVQGW